MTAIPLIRTEPGELALRVAWSGYRGDLTDDFVVFLLLLLLRLKGSLQRAIEIRYT